MDTQCNGDGTMRPSRDVVKFLNSLIPNPLTMKVRSVSQNLRYNIESFQFDYWVGNFEPVAHLAPPYGLVIEVDGNSGEIVSSLHSTNGAVRFISEAYIHDRLV